MSQQEGSTRGKKAWTVQWRNFQGRKNKSWEYDGYMLVAGLGVTVHSDEGKLLGAKNLTKPPREDEEFSISNNKEVRVGDEISLKEYYRNVLPGADADDAASTPAKVVPGFFTRPGMVASTSTPQQHTTPRPSAARAASPAVSAPLDTPDSAGKRWAQPRDKQYKPFKPLLPSATKRSSSVGPGGVGGGGTSTPGPSRLRESSVDGDETSRASRERRLEELKAARDGKGKARAVPGPADASDEELENSPPEHAAEGSAAKKRRLDPPRAAFPPARPASRLSAADAAFERALGNTSSATRTTSLPERAVAPAQPLFRQGASVPPPARVKDEPLDSEDDDEGLISADDMEIEVDPNVFADGGPAWAGELEEEEEDVKPKVPVRAAGSGTMASQREESTRRFACQWRKRTMKKHPVWEDDGVLVVRGNKAELEDKDSGKRLGSTTLTGGVKLDDGDILRVGEMEVEVGEELAVRAPSKSGSSQRSSQLSLVQPTALAIKPFRAPAPSKAVNPLAARIASRSPERTRSTPRPTTSETAQSALPPGVAKFKMPGLASMSVVSSSAAYGVKESKKGQRFDPNAEGAIVMRRPDAEHQKVYNKRGFPIVDVVVDPLIGDKLRDHQKEGVAFMYECVMGMRTAGQGCLLADDMGLGKTIQSIALIWTLLKQNPYHGASAGVIDRVMIVCPVTLIKNWSAEIKKWLGRDKLRVYVADAKHPVSTFARNKSYDVLIVGYDKVRAYIDDVKYAQPPIGLIICDEGHRLKSEKAKTTQALQSLSCMRRVILSGTPIQNNLGEFFAMLDFVNPGLLNDAAYFKKNFEQPILASRQPRATAKEKEAGKEASESLFAVQRNFVLRRTNEIILKHLPPKLEFTVFIRPTKLQLDLYREVLSSSLVRSMLEGLDRKQGLPLLQSVLKLSTSPGLVMKHIKDNGLGHLDESILDVLPKDGDAADFTLSGKFAVLGSLLSDLRANSEEKIVVVSNFTSTLDLIETHCKRKKYPYCRLDGKTPQTDRIPMVESFNRGSHRHQFVFLLSSKGGGTGLNIIGASRLVQVDSDWNPSNDLQAMARIHREGQKRTCVIYRFLTAGTVDEVIFQRQVIKLALSGSVMDQDGAAAAKSKDAFTLDELRNLFTLHESVACQTHELLGCRCHFGEVPDDDDDAQDDDDSDEDDEMDGFVQASQFQDDDAVRKMSKQRRNLSILKTWQHYNCTDEDSIDDIEDPLLKSVIWARMARAADDDAGIEPEGHGKLPLCGGQVGFVFGKKSGVA
ncbi:helicase [Rhodotorula kratochvilovae]